MLLATLFVLIITFVLSLVIKQLVQNFEGQKHFNRAKNLVVLPKANILTGHLLQTWWNPKNYKITQQLHEIYGRTYAFYLCARPVVQSTDLDLIKLVMLDQGDKHIDRMNYNTPYKELSMSIIQTNGELWRAARRVVAPSMTNHKVRSDPTNSDIASIVAQFQGYLSLKSEEAASKGDGGFELDSWHNAKRFTVATILYITYKRDNVVDFVHDRDAWVDNLGEMAIDGANNFTLMAILFPFLEPIMFRLAKFTKVSKNFEILLGMIHKVIEANRSSSSKQSDNNKQEKRLPDELIETYLAKNLDIAALKGTLMVLFFAGFETTAGAIDHLTWRLAKHQDIQAKLRRDVLAHGINSEYLHWCLMETLRVHTPIAIGFGRVLAEDLHYKDMMIPKGTLFSPSVWAAHYDPDIWPEPHRFMPERWAKQSEFHPAQFLSFGLGPRNCVGAKLALHEMRLLFAMLLAKFRIETCPSTPETYEFISPTMINAEVEVPTVVRLVPIEQTAL